MFDENLSKNVKSLAYEKSIDVERVFKALEDALATAARKYYRTREPMETILDRASGAVKIQVIKEIVEDENQIEDPQAQWTLDQARKVDPSAEVGGTRSTYTGAGNSQSISENLGSPSENPRMRGLSAANSIASWGMRL